MSDEQQTVTIPLDCARWYLKHLTRDRHDMAAATLRLAIVEQTPLEVGWHQVKATHPDESKDFATDSYNVRWFDGEHWTPRSGTRNKWVPLAPKGHYESVAYLGRGIS